MESNSHRHFTFDYKHFLIDEIALDGLEGIGIDLLWRRMEKRISSPITLKMKMKFWKFIVDSESIMLYQLSEPPPHVEILDRFTIIDERTGHVIDPPDYLDGPYEFHPVQNEFGSCPSYDKRFLIPKDAIQLMTYEEVLSQYGDKLALVASMEERWKALASHLPMTYLNQLTPTHYCILELIGRGRENGQMTIGMTNLNKIVKQPKLLFYNRNVLQKLDLIKNQYCTQVTGGKAMKSILLRLKRFHQPTLLTLPKVGQIHKMVKYLLNQPDHAEQNEILIKKGLMTPQQSKRLQKGMNVFGFEDREVKLERKANAKSEKKIFVRKRFMTLIPQSDESSQSDEETNDVPLKCQYKVGVTLMRQAYERFLEAGLNGLTQVEIAQLLGVEFYTSRTICRHFKANNIVREFLEDKGRQRTARYIAVAATKEVDKEYANEKMKLLNYINEAKIVSNENDETPTDKITEDGEYEVPLKKIKLEMENNDTEDNTEPDITEIKVLEGFENVKESLLNSKKNPTLRQLKFANGILKLIHELKYVIGFQTLSTLVSKEIKEPPMDTKALKLFVQKLVTDGQLKIFKLKRPKNYNKFAFLICSPHIKATDPVIKLKYKEICARKVKNTKTKHTNQAEISRPLSQFVYPRYLKIQKLHEFIIKLIYFSDIKPNPSYPLGFGSLFYIIPEMTVEFALGNINNIDMTEIGHMKLNEEIYATKLRDAPDNLSRILFKSKGLQNSIRIGLKVLAVLGLIQLINQSSSIISGDGGLVPYVFYVNRNAKVLDTSGKWPREDVLSGSLEKSFHFNSMEDVANYWNEVYTISSNTTINLSKRERHRLIHPMRNDCSVVEFDNGERFGDGLGPCGFDSSIFMDISRLWRTYLIRNTSMTPKPQKMTKKIKNKKIIKKKTNIVPKSTNIIKNQKPIRDKVTEEITKVKVERNIQRKAVDSHVWSEFEDKVIMMCKAAITIMSPVSQPGSLKIRNTVAKDLLAMYGPKKTASMCHKRALTLESNSVLAHEKDCIINELRCRPTLIKKYEGLLKVLRLRHYANISRYVKEARLPMMELVWLISQIQKTKPFLNRVPCIAMDLNDFYNKYTITPSSANRAYNMYKTPLTYGPEFATLKESIMLTVMMSLNHLLNTETAKKIYLMFKTYSEPTLRSAIEHLRKCGAIAAREKILNNHFNKINFDDIVQSSYKIAAVYKRKWINRLEGEFVDNLADIINTGIPQQGLKGSCELNCILCELCSCDVLDIVSDTVPVVMGWTGSLIQEEQMNVIDIETKYKLKSGLVGWRSKSNFKEFSDMYKHIDYENALNSLSKDALVKITNKHDLDTSDVIISCLLNKKEEGCTFSELQKLVSIERSNLSSRLKGLEAKGIIKRVGIYENRIVLTKFSKPYLLQIQPELHMIPTPWLNIEAEINIEVFFKWTGVIMNKIFESPGCSVSYLSNNFEYISIRSVLDICMFLERCECIKLKFNEKKELDLFTDNDDVPDFCDYTCYDPPECILAFPVKDCFTKYSFIRQKCVEPNKND
ncbi:unnamed protein product [Euphydryas editha]|uniref:B-block binding subunit of TFIIIC domain-containing protein n=1 Tax=Euphydryas editha TaxID=104508 RepID=A0AAU9TVW4_EUPED|nr:unnamed protein product [Euphydryas editha]